MHPDHLQRNTNLNASTMGSMMKAAIGHPRVTISTFDFCRLQELLLVIRQFASSQPRFVRDLELELSQAQIVPPEEIPRYIVTMNTQFKLTEIESGKERTYTLVFPCDADLEEGKLSILSDLGVAILGYGVGDTIEWDFPEGRKRIRVDMICFQPEASKRFDL